MDEQPLGLGAGMEESVSDTELEAEWQVEYLTRIGSLCNNSNPTREQSNIAFDEAQEHKKKLKEQEHERSR